MSVYKNWTSSAVRRCFVGYFSQKHDHKWIPSSSVIPDNDPDLLFTNAGMNQFKSIFTDKLPSGHPFKHIERAVSYQKCIRTGGKHDDLDQVGHNLRHHTFFEMLGNWSFGDYFKVQSPAKSKRFNRLFETFSGKSLFNGTRSSCK